ncbi:2893_t:CDS:1, partial [Cetraspora pellucida]
RIQALLSDYIGDIFTVNKDRKAQSYMEVVWKLADDLTTSFQLSNPATHELFKYSKEINEVGFSLIATCYAEGIKRLNSIYNQEILKTEEKIVKGRRSCNLNVYKLSSLLNNDDNDKKKRKKINVTDDDSSNKTINDEMNSPSTKRICRATSKNVKEILTRLLVHTTFSDNDQLLYDVLHELQDIKS